jgi:TP901 family phage tail tape measure protein
MSKGLIIPTTFTAIDKFRPTVQGMVNSLEGFTAKASAAAARSERAFRRLTPALGETQKQLLSMVGTAALVGGAFNVGRFSVTSIMDYETAIQSLQAVTGVSHLQMQEFKKEISSVASASRKSSIDVAKSFETVGSAMSQYLEDPKGLRAITEAGITLSKAARMELEPTLMSLTSVMNQFGVTASGAMDVVNRLTAGEIVGSIRTSDATGFLQEFGAVAKNMNVTVGESTALIEALGIQMDKTKIGVGARNILTILSAAGGLDKKARKDLHAAGVDTKFLMDNTHSLSARLHELSKISKDPIKMVSVFGRENLTAGQVIFQQLSKYDEFAEKIMTTNKAQEQAVTNSRTFRESLNRLSASWVNMLTSSSKTESGINTASRALEYVTNNLDSLVDTGVSVLKFFALWKAANLTAAIVSGGFSIAVGVQSAVLGVSTLAMKGNTLALATQSAVMKTAQIATAVFTADMAALNLALGTSPVGLVVLGVAALAGGIGYLAYKQGELNKEQERQRSLRLDHIIKDQATQVNNLATAYQRAGFEAHNATLKSLQFHQASATEKVIQAKSRLESANQKEISVTDSALFPAFSSEVLNARRETAMAKQALTEALSYKLGTTNSLISSANTGAISRAELMQLIQGKSVETSARNNFPAQNTPSLPNAPFLSSGINLSDLKPTDESMLKAATTITLKNDSNSEAVIESAGKSRSVMPSTTSTMTVNKRK